MTLPAKPHHRIRHDRLIHAQTGDDLRDDFADQSRLVFVGVGDGLVAPFLFRPFHSPEIADGRQ